MKRATNEIFEAALEDANKQLRDGLITKEEWSDQLVRVYNKQHREGAYNA